MLGGTLKGNFVGLSASRDGNEYFAPSMCGGLLAVDGERIVYPCDEKVLFRLGSQFFTNELGMSGRSLNRAILVESANTRST